MFVHLLKTLLLWNGSKALKDIVQVDNKWCITIPKSPDCNQISNLKRSASWIGSEFQDIGCLEFQSRNTRNVSRKGKKSQGKNSLIVRKKDWIGRVKVLWNKRGTCIFAYLPKICKPPAMHFTSFCIELELNIHSPIAQETPRSSILVQHHASSKSFLARRKGNLFSYLTIWAFFGPKKASVFCWQRQIVLDWPCPPGSLADCTSPFNLKPTFSRLLEECLCLCCCICLCLCFWLCLLFVFLPSSWHIV